MSTQDALTEINNIAFAARNQIQHWKSFNIPPNVGSIKIALEGIIDICEQHTAKENFEEEEED